jgi:hypothetical protein
MTGSGPFGALHGKSPVERFLKLSENKTPLSDQMEPVYDPGKESRCRDYGLDPKLAKVKRCM